MHQKKKKKKQTITTTDQAGYPLQPQDLLTLRCLYLYGCGLSDAVKLVLEN